MQIFFVLSYQLDKTIELAKLIESTKVAALAVHGRKRDERPHHKNRNHFIQAIASALAIPVIAKCVIFCLPVNRMTQTCVFLIALNC